MSHLRSADLSETGVAADAGALDEPAPLVEEIAIPVNAIRFRRSRVDSECALSG